ncbi:MAG: hypothetical protein GY844_11600 [Bradyrhizobium sp.]|uniref:Uncharacterized protein n=1 Tax=Afipia broomeae ATCC 49717 TaxID=883078 RepID=K8NZA0_9BRAD|nr:hypothetical protein [Afipia broomeae]EKS34536.1 hypothetical protein HMPREF9695_04446 [Afipia broomeae ATCC 49717]MCP4617069.1 hypothetical protein [Bradyrhizobium sp.]
MKNFIATTSLILPLVAAAVAAHAGSTITDKSYWPNEARKPQVDTTRSNPSAAFASGVYVPNSSAPMRPGNAWRYQGGPKGR